MTKTNISWADHVWNPVVGCSPVGAGCDNCYARRLHNQRHIAFLAGKQVPAQYAHEFSHIQLLPERLEAPLHVRKPGVWFVDSMSDLFHKDVPDEFIDRVFTVMACAAQTKFVILTKRAKRMREYISREIAMLAPHIILGVSAWDQASFDANVAELLQTPAACRIVSLEPLLGPVDFKLRRKNVWCADGQLRSYMMKTIAPDNPIRGIDGVIVGGETGPNARPMHPGWVRSLRDQCAEAGVAFFFKQWGEWAPREGYSPKHRNRHFCFDGPSKATPELKEYNGLSLANVFRYGSRAAGRTLDGRTHDELPEAMRV